MTPVMMFAAGSATSRRHFSETWRSRAKPAVGDLAGDVGEHRAQRELQREEAQERAVEDHDRGAGHHAEQGRQQRLARAPRRCTARRRVIVDDGHRQRAGRG